MKGPRGTVATAIALGMLAIGVLAGAGPAWAKGSTTPGSTPFRDIASSGPLTHVYLGNELSCQVAHTGDTDLELYPPDTVPGDCGTFLVVQGTDTLYAPNFRAHGGTATGSLGDYTPWTPVSQSAVSGSGTSSDPYKVTTVADAAVTGLEVTQVDTYVIGQESYTSTITVDNAGAASQSLVLYRAGDCFLGGSDNGTGRVTGTAIACVQPESGRSEEWVPITGGSSYYENFYDTTWGYIGSHQAFDNTCTCSQELDNSAGLSWTFSLSAGASQTFSHITTFSPTGNESLTTSKTADSSTAAPGGQDGYTITISNPNAEDVTLDTITDTLPDGFSYVAGSSSGVTTSDPDVSGQDLTWNGPFTAPANGDVTLHFLVTVATVAGDYTNNAGGTAEGGFTVAPTGPTAQITVESGADLSITKSDSPDPVFVGNDLTYTLTASNAGPETASNVVVTDALPADVTFKSASPSSCTESGGTVTCDLGDMAADTDVSMTIVVTADSVGTVTNTATVSSDTADPDTSNNSDSAKTTVNAKPSGGVQTGIAPAGGNSILLPLGAGLALVLMAGAGYAVRRRRRA